MLVTISCLLIQPNPASALNEEAGKLANEDWAGFCRRAKLMTEIHAAVPTTLVNEVREAQMRGEDKGTELFKKESRPDARGKSKERVISTPPTSSKGQRAPPAEDEENAKHRGGMLRSGSDESDWIPRPTMSAQKPRNHKHEENILGLNPDVSLEDAPKRIPVSAHIGGPNTLTPGDADVFTTPAPIRTTHPQTSSIIHLSLNNAAPQQDGEGAPESLNFPHKSPFLVVQPGGQPHPLLRELSYQWVIFEAQHENGSYTGISDSHSSMLKRPAGDDLERRKKWELKHFKRAGCNLKRYNRGDFGPRTGIGRL